jgi:hypothetical protein
MEFDLGHGYQDSHGEEAEEVKALLWVFGTLDELKTLGLLDVAGDSPLKDRAQRKRYREIRDSGFAPGIADVSRILRKYSAEIAQPAFLRLFQLVITHGIRKFKQEVQKEKAERKDAADNDGFFKPGGGQVWIPLN